MGYTHRAAILAALLLSFSGICAQVFAEDTRFQLEMSRHDGDVFMTVPLHDHEPWCLLWNHSVTGFLVRDCFARDHEVMVLSSSHQPDFAAGLGHLEGRGNLESDGAGGYLITEINEPVPNNALILRVGSMSVNHRVLYKGQETSLSSVAAGQRVTIRLAQM